MVNAITHSISDFCHAVVLDPYCEATARINRAIEGVNLHHIEHPKLSLSERIIDILLGVALLVPLINSIVLVFMRTIGSSEPLSKKLVAMEEEPWAEAVEDGKIEITPEVQVVKAVEEAKPIETTVRYLSVEENNQPATISSSTLETHADKFVLKTMAPGKLIKFDLDTQWKTKSMHWVDPNTDVTLRKTKNNTITVTGEKRGHIFNKPPLKLDDPTLPWIQNPHGFRPFLKSVDTKIESYGVHPEDMCVYKFETKKILSEIPDTIKIETSICDWKKLNATIATLWFEKDTLELVKTDFRLGLFAWGKAENVDMPAENQREIQGEVRV